MLWTCLFTVILYPRFSVYPDDRLELRGRITETAGGGRADQPEGGLQQPGAPSQQDLQQEALVHHAGAVPHEVWLGR